MIRFSKYISGLIIFFLLVLLPSNVLAQKKTNFRPSPSPSPSPTITSVDSYKLFWPISAGRVMGDSFYFLKSFKENLREISIFSDFKKADYNITLSEKRVVEVEKLFLVNKDYVNGKKTLDAVQQRREKALSFINKVKKEGRNVADLQNRMASSLENQRALLNYVAAQVPEEQKQVIENNISSLNSLFVNLR